MATRDDCDSIVRQLWPSLDGALPDAWQARVAAHLEQCANCRSHFDYEQQFLAAVRTAGAMTDTDDGALRDRVVRALVAQGFAG